MTISLSTDNENVCTGMNRIITSLADIADTRLGLKEPLKRVFAGSVKKTRLRGPQARSSRTGHNWFACVMFDMWVTL